MNMKRKPNKIRRTERNIPKWIKRKNEDPSKRVIKEMSAHRSQLV